MEQTLADFMTQGVFAFMLVFVRLGTAVMIMPGVGDSFVSERIRLLFALAFSFALFPLLINNVPSPIPGTFGLIILILMEFIIGLFIGSIARVFMAALDTAGMVISIQSGLGNAQVFNPSMATQGSIMGAFMSVTGAVVLFATDMHHLLFMGLYDSYQLFPVGGLPEVGSMAQLFTAAVSAAFRIGVQIGAPFIVLTLLIYTGMGVLSRLMPQVQVFLIALPMQILLAIVLMAVILPAAFMFWLGEFEGAMGAFIK